MLPGGFLFLAAIARTFFHRARLTAVFYFAAFGVMDGLMEAALVGFFVNLGATDFVAALHDIDGGFFAALELAQHIVNESVFDEGGNSFWCLHQSKVCINTGCAGAARFCLIPRHWINLVESGLDAWIMPQIVACGHKTSHAQSARMLPHLMRCFTDVTSMAPLAYLQALKIERVKELLEVSNADFETITEKVGIIIPALVQSRDGIIASAVPQAV